MIESYGDVTALSILVGLMVWYFKHQTRQNTKREDKSDKERADRENKHDEQQKEERDYYRGIIKDELKENAVLNTKSLTLQKGMMKDLENHSGHSEKFSEKVIRTITLQNETLGLICDKLNGSSKKMTKAKKKLSEKT